MLSPGYIKVAAHPEHGEPVVYMLGQLLPEWLSSLLESGAAMLRPLPEPGYFELVMREAPRAARRPGGSVKR